MSSTIVFDHSCHKFLNVFALSKASLEDQLMDDTTFIYELVDAVRILFTGNAELFVFCHREFADLRLSGKAHRRVWLLLMACQRYNVEPYEQNRCR